ncbi:hypothetical protein N0Y54_37575 [Nostoc punctiforme UO1]
MGCYLGRMSSDGVPARLLAIAISTTVLGFAKVEQFSKRWSHEAIVAR